MKATEGRLICEVIKDDKKTQGGIILARAENTEINKGKVVSVGPVKKDVHQTFNVGQTVIWGNYQGVKYSEGKVEYVVLNQADVLAVDE